jgi:hypothetical protein
MKPDPKIEVTQVPQSVGLFLVGYQHEWTSDKHVRCERQFPFGSKHGALGKANRSFGIELSLKIMDPEIRNSKLHQNRKIFSTLASN